MGITLFCPDSVIQGIKAMHKSNAPKAKWFVNWLGFKKPMFWCHAWTPVWHDGRGPYLNVGLGIFSFGRGY